MPARHAGESRIADQALIDQVRACAEEMRAYIHSPIGSDPDFRRWLHRWSGRAWSLLEQIGEMGE